MTHIGEQANLNCRQTTSLATASVVAKSAPTGCSSTITTTTTTTTTSIDNDLKIKPNLATSSKHSFQSPIHANASRIPDANNKTTDLQTLMHQLKANVGAGMLAMPFAFKQVGLYAALIIAPIVGLLTGVGMNFLVECNNTLCDRFNFEHLDYDQVAALSFAVGPKVFRRHAKFASRVVIFLLFFSQVGFCCVMITFVTDNLHISIENLFNINLNHTTYLLIMYPLVAITSSSSNLRYLATVSTTANCFLLTAFFIILAHVIPFDLFDSFGQKLLSEYQTTNNVTMHNAQLNNAVPTIVHAISPNFWYGLPIFFSQAIYAFEGINIILPLTREMQEPARMGGPTGVLNTSLWIIACMYIGLGYFGYLKFGQFLHGSITLNLPDTAASEIARLFYATAVCLSFSIQFYVVWTMVWPYIDESLFYSYKPREPRGNLKILENLWRRQVTKARSTDQQPHNNTNSITTDEEGLVDSSSVSKLNQDDIDVESNASTFATSYCVSVHQPILGTSEKYRQQASSSASNQHYGSVVMAKRQVRNRLDDLIENEDEYCEVPDIQSRRSPGSMRGKRKVVRFSLILLFVAIIFSMAATVPRIDLIISLIGAFAGGTLSLTLPALIHIGTYWNHDYDDKHEIEASRERALQSKRKIVWSLFFILDLLMIVVGVAGLIVGTWISMSKIVRIWIHAL